MRNSRHLRGFVLASLLVFVWSGCGRDSLLAPDFDPVTIHTASKDAPAGYYDSVDASTPAALRATLHDVIDDHTRFPYTSTATDTWNILELADEDPNDPGNILDVYRNASYAKEGGGNSFYNREHSWPSSYGYPNDGSTNYVYTDCHALFLCDDGYNSSRSNKPFRTCDASCSENPTDVNNGMGGGSGTYPGNSNWTSGSNTTGTWETWAGRRGDVARAQLYLDLRYEGGTHGGTGVGEPDLILTNVEALIAASNTGSNESVAYMGMLSVLLQWHLEDPVDDAERARNDVVFSFQGNRNPFVDHPEWVDCVFSGACGGDTTPPAAPAALVAVAGVGSVDLDWADNGESDLAGYNVQRSTSSGGSYTQINTSLVTSSAFTDTAVMGGTTYYYVVTAVDTTGNESAASNETNATPTGGGVGSVAWINEFHYDNAGTDVGEFVEVAGSAGTDLSGWSVVGYNGNGGSTYKTVNLSGSLADQSGGFGTLSFVFSSMQNGAPDGLALVDDVGNVVEFLSYEGTMTASGGPANGLTSTDVGIAESSGTSVGSSLQRVGTGTSAAEFTWSGPAADSPGSPNAGQSFGGGGGDTTPPAAPVGLVAAGGNGFVDLDWADNTEPDLAGYNVFRSTVSGGPYSSVATLIGSSDFNDASVTNGTTYYYIVTAEDTSGNESGDSTEASATPEAPLPVVWINEFHYDDKGRDQGEFVEVAGTAGVDLSGWQIVLYNGSNGNTYLTTTLSGSIANQESGFGTSDFAMALQNGAPDGIALIDDQGNVVEFLSYEGTMTANNGPAVGLTSVDVGVSESSSTKAGRSLQRTGIGVQGSDFVWTGPDNDSPGQPNSGQDFGAAAVVAEAAIH